MLGLRFLRVPHNQRPICWLSAATSQLLAMLTRPLRQIQGPGCSMEKKVQPEVCGACFVTHECVYIVYIGKQICAVLSTLKRDTLLNPRLN